MAHPLASIITPTYDGGPQTRRIVMERCIRSVQDQTYPNLEHVVVSDGPNPEFARELDRYVRTGLVRHPIRHFELGRSWHKFTPQPSWGTSARLAASFLIRGDLVAYNDHDDVLMPNHVADLSELLAKAGVDFVYSQMLVFVKGRPSEIIIGDGTPRWRHISQQLLLHKIELFNVANFDPHCKWNKLTLPDNEKRLATYGSDWDLVGRWLEAGCTWAFLPEITVHSWPAALQ